MLGRKSKKRDVRKRLKALEQRFDLSGLESRLEGIGGGDLDKVLSKIDWKDLEKKIEKDFAQRAAQVRKLGKQEEPSSSSAGFFAGLVIGALVGVVLAILFGKQNEGSEMDRFVSSSDAPPEQPGYPPSGGPVGTNLGSAAPTFGDDAAIEREIITDDDIVNTAGDTIDSASSDVREATEDIADNTNRPTRNL